MKKSSYIWNFLVIIAVTLLVLYFSLKDNFREVLDAVMTMNPFMFILVCFWGILYTIVWGGVYFILGRKYQPRYSIRNGISVALVGAFFAGITPSATGGQFGQAYVMKKQGIAYSDGASILWTDFIIYQTTMMIYCTILFVLKFGQFAGENLWLYLVLIGYLVNLAVVLGLYTMALFPKVYIRLAQKTAGLLGKMHILKNPQRTLTNWTLQMTSFTTQIKQLSKDKTILIECFVINIIRLTLLYSLPYTVAYALHIDVHPYEIITVIALSSFVSMANTFVPIPGASGGTEVMFSLLFAPLFGHLTTAVMLLWRLSSYYIVIFIGGLTFFFATRSKTDEEAEPSLPGGKD